MVHFGFIFRFHLRLVPLLLVRWEPNEDAPDHTSRCGEAGVQWGWNGMQGAGLGLDWAWFGPWLHQTELDWAGWAGLRSSAVGWGCSGAGQDGMGCVLMCRQGYVGVVRDRVMGCGCWNV